MKKKILALLLAGCMAAGLCACGTPAADSGTGDTSGTTATADGDTVVIGVLTMAPAASRSIWACSMPTPSPLR